jgi:DNA-binding NarL/FixJ family response regulator
VESHQANLMNKLGLSSPAQLVRYAIEHGLLE